MIEIAQDNNELINRIIKIEALLERILANQAQLLSHLSNEALATIYEKELDSVDQIYIRIQQSRIREAAIRKKCF